MPQEKSRARYKSSGLSHPLQEFGAVPLARETLDEVLSGYRRPNDKVSEWLREGALQPLRRTDPVERERIQIIDHQCHEAVARRQAAGLGPARAGLGWIIIDLDNRHPPLLHHGERRERV